MADPLERAIASVVRNGNCTGCGGCAAILPRVRMSLNDSGFQRPIVAPFASADRAELGSFRAVCPGVAQVAPSVPESFADPVFGPVMGMWRAWATDPAVRRAGSSGGVLTALSGLLVESGAVSAVGAVSGSVSAPTTSIPVQIMRREDALAAAGSRYAPVAAVAGYEPGRTGYAVVGKPCEIAAVSRMEDLAGTPAAQRPVRLSFFCAGTPSQKATDALTTELGVKPGEVASLRYRGDGWPGSFTVHGRTGRIVQASYADSWGRVLGRSLQPRCKVCVDGTGMDADISVGDLWETSTDGYPGFDEREGQSVLIARTARGLTLVNDAVAAGVITITPVSSGEAASVQPLQVARRRTLAARLLGKALAGQRVPHYRGYGLVRLGLANPVASAKALAGTWVRTAQARRAGIR